MRKIKIADLVFDTEVYPRGSVDSQHVSNLAAAIEAGVTVPPLIVEKKTHRVIDGYHRAKAMTRLWGEDHKVQCAEREYANESELFADAMRLNASHGRALDSHDRAHCIIVAERLRLDMTLVAEALSMTPDKVRALRAQRIGRTRAGPIALKQTVRHMAGQNLTDGQVAANKKLSGMNQQFYANQLILLVESDLIDPTPQLIDSLHRLSNLLNSFLSEAA